MKWLGWAILGLVVLHRKTWGACDCSALRRRLRIQTRELWTWKNEARQWKYKYERQNHE